MGEAAMGEAAMQAHGGGFIARDALTPSLRMSARRLLGLPEPEVHVRRSVRRMPCQTEISAGGSAALSVMPRAGQSLWHAGDAHGHKTVGRIITEAGCCVVETFRGQPKEAGLPC